MKENFIKNIKNKTVIKGIKQNKNNYLQRYYTMVIFMINQ